MHTTVAAAHHLEYCLESSSSHFHIPSDIGFSLLHSPSRTANAVIPPRVVQGSSSHHSLSTPLGHYHTQSVAFVGRPTSSQLQASPCISFNDPIILQALGSSCRAPEGELLQTWFIGEGPLASTSPRPTTHSLLYTHNQHCLYLVHFLIG